MSRPDGVTVTLVSIPPNTCAIEFGADKIFCRSCHLLGCGRCAVVTFLHQASEQPALDLPRLKAIHYRFCRLPPEYCRNKPCPLTG